MKRDLFRRYVWLIDTIRHCNKVTFEEISNMWKNSPMNDDASTLALRTFHNHRDAIENLFGIKIICDRSDHHRYYVDNRMELDKLKIWMLQTLSLSDSVEEAGPLGNRVLVDMTPDEKFGINAIIEAMKQNRMLEVTHTTGSTDFKRETKVAPYCVRFNNHSWYLLAREPLYGQMLVFDLRRVCHITILDESFIYESDFNPSEFFQTYYGMDVRPGFPPVDIHLRVKGKTRDELRLHPLHDTQREIRPGGLESVFEFRFVPGERFKKAVLAMGDDVEVLAPETLRTEIAERISSMACNYSV